MKIFKIEADHPDQGVIEVAIDALKKNEVIAYLTDTLYGLGANARSTSAIEKIYELKQRSTEKALPVIIGNHEMLDGWIAEIPQRAHSLMKKFWPGPLTIIFKAGAKAPQNLTGGTGKLAVRIPDSVLARELSIRLKAPIAATSANLANMPAATSVEEIIEQFAERIPVVLDSGPAASQIPSTILDVTEIPTKIIRQGAITLEKLTTYLGEIQA